MKLKDKFLNSPDEQGWTNPDISRAENNVKIADDFAIKFARFVGNHIYSYYENDTWSNDLEKKDLTTKELLEIFKKEKGL